MGVGPVLPIIDQPADSDLTAIAALSTTSYGRSLLELANAAALATSVATQTAFSSQYVPSTVVDAAYGDGTTDAAAHIQAKIDAAAAVGGVVYVPEGVYAVSTSLIIPSDIAIIGAGSELTTIKLRAGGSGDVLKSANFDSLTLTASTGGVTGVTLRGFTIDGNKANDLAGAWGIRKYGYRWRISDLDIVDCAAGGIYSEWTSAAGVGADGGFMEDILHDVRVHSCATIGVQWRGPHDSRFDNVLIYANGSHGMTVEGLSGKYHAGGIVLTAVHVYGNLADGIRVTSDNNQGATIIGAGVISESNTGTGLVIGANGCFVSTGKFYSNGSHGIDIQSAAAAWHIHADCQANAGSALNFTSDGGDAMAIITAYTSGAGQSVVTGSPSSTTALFVVSTGSGTLAKRLVVPGVLSADSSTGLAFLTNITDGPVIDLTGKSTVDGREIIKGTGGTDTYYQITVDKELRVQNTAGTRQTLTAGSLSSDSALTVGAGLIYLGDSATMRLNRGSSTNSGYAYWDDTEKRLKLGAGSGVTKRVVTDETDTTTNLASISATVNTSGKYAGKCVFNTSTSKPVWAAGSTAGAVWVDATGSTAHTPV